MTDFNDTQPETGSNPFWLIGLVLLAFLGFSAASIALPHDPYIRYQQLGDTMHAETIGNYEKLHFDNTPIDIAIIGNSRLRSGVISDLLSAELEDDLGAKPNVINLSMAQEGRNAHFSLARELLETHPETKLIILSAIEQMPREGHPSFRTIANSGDVLRAPLLVNRTYLDDLVFLPFRQMSLFAQTQLPKTFGVRREYSPAPAENATLQSEAESWIPPWELEWGAFPSRQTEEQIRAAAIARVTGINDQLLPEWAADFEFTHERAYTGQIAKMAGETGTRLAFLYLPIFENPEPLRQLGYYEDLGPVFSATHLADDAEIFRDYGHFNPDGSMQLTRWLAEQIIERETLPAAGDGE